MMGWQRRGSIVSANAIALVRASGILALACAGNGCAQVLGLGDFKESSAGGAPGTSESSATEASSSAQVGSSSSTGGAGGQISTGDITGKQLHYHVSMTGMPDGYVATDFSDPAARPTAYSLDASGTFTSYPAASGDANGYFTISGVPDGPYLLVLPKRAYWLTNRSALDFSSYQLAPLSYTPLMNDPQVHLVLNDLTPWQDGDILELIDPVSTAYTFDDDPAALLSPPWTVGATQIDASGDWLGFVFGIDVPVQSTSTVSIFHSGMRGHPYKEVLDYATTSFSTPDQASPPFDVTATFTTVTPINTPRELYIDTPAFESKAQAMNPRATPRSTTVDYQVHPTPATYGQLMGTADLALQSFPAGTPKQHLTYLYGNPFDGWSEFVGLTADANLDYTLPGTSATDLGLGGASTCFLKVDDPAIKSQTVAFGPLDEPPTTAAIEGHSFFNGGQQIAITTLTPTLTWTWAMPHQDIEIVAVKVADDGNGAVAVQGARRIFADGAASSARFPPGFIDPGSHYVFLLRGRSHMDLDYQQTPSLQPWPVCWGQAASDIVATP